MGSNISQASGINDAGQAVGASSLTNGTEIATEWSRGRIIDLGVLPGYMDSDAISINDAGQAVGVSILPPVPISRPSGAMAGHRSGRPARLHAKPCWGINDAGQVVGWSLVGGSIIATEWSHGQVIDLGGLSGSMDSIAIGINDAGRVVGASQFGTGFEATEWSDGQVIDLGGLPGYTFSLASGINDAGRAVGYSLSLSGVIPEILDLGDDDARLRGARLRRLSTYSVVLWGQPVNVALARQAMAAFTGRLFSAERFANRS